MERYESEFSSIVKTLNKNKVDFLLIGDYAVIFHGFTRNTADIDFWFKPTIENYFKLLNAMEEYGIDTDSLKDEVFNPEKTFLRFMSNRIKIEFLSMIPGSFSYREASEASVKTKINGVNVKVIHIDHLIENKSELNRPMDKVGCGRIKKKENASMKWRAFTAVVLAMTFTASPAQNNFDLRHYNIRLSLSDVSSQSLQGCCTVRIKSETNGLQQVSLSLLALTVDAITVNQTAVAFTNDDTTLNIQLPVILNQGDSTEIEICYHGQPVEDASWGGFYFSGDYAFNIGVAFTSEPHTFGRVWFPCVDNFTDRATYEFHITTANNHKAFCSGLLQGSTNNPDGTITWHWRINQAIPTYLASVAVSSYTALEGKYPLIAGDSVPYMLAAQAVDTANLRNSFIHLPDALAGFEECFGRYRFDRVGFVVVPFSGGAMEHATNIAYPGFAVTGGLQYETLMAHEFSHHWFGDLVTCATAEDMWLNEGWASYSESIFMEKVYGKEAYKEEVRKNHKNVLQNAHIRDDGYRAVSGVPHEYTYGSTVYDKGADIAHTLRAYLGDSLFFSCIADYLDAFKFNDASSYDFRNHLSQCSSIDLTAFFDNWVFARGFPHFSIDSFFVANNSGAYDVTVFIRQRLKEAPALYSNVPLELTFISENFDSATTSVTFSGGCGIYHTAVNFDPSFVAIDMNEKLSDAVTDNYDFITATGTYTFEEALMTLIVNSVPSKALIRVEHNWLAPDPMKSTVPGLHISTERYWKVDGIIPTGFSSNARIIFDGTAANGYLDKELLTNSEDSIVVLFRPDTRSDWSLHPDFSVNTQGNPNNKSGQITINNIAKGEYAIGIKDVSRPVTDTQIVNTPCAILSERDALSEQNDLDFQISPNPVNDSFYIRFDQPLQTDVAFSIMDLSGKLIYQFTLNKGKDNINVSTHGWNKSAYLVRAVDSKSSSVKKVMVLN